jgi:hypothetical protein
VVYFNICRRCGRTWCLELQTFKSRSANTCQFLHLCPMHFQFARYCFAKDPPTFKEHQPKLQFGIHFQLLRYLKRSVQIQVPLFLVRNTPGLRADSLLAFRSTAIAEDHPRSTVGSWPVHVVKTYMGEEIYIHWIGGWVGPLATLLWRRGWETNLLYMGTSPFIGCPARSSVTILTGLSWLPVR